MLPVGFRYSSLPSPPISSGGWEALQSRIVDLYIQSARLMSESMGNGATPAQNILHPGGT